MHCYVRWWRHDRTNLLHPSDRSYAVMVRYGTVMLKEQCEVFGRFLLASDGGAYYLIAKRLVEVTHR